MTGLNLFKCYKQASSTQLKSQGFTLIELVVVVSIIGIATLLVVINTGSFAHWQEEGFLRRMMETIEFLHHQAVQDGEHYRIEFDFESNSYKIGVLKTEQLNNSAVIALSQDAGALSLELATILNPSIGKTHSLIPPPSFPSLAEPTSFPEHLYLRDLRNLSGIHTKADVKRASIMFSPRGFSEFAVLHLASFDNDNVITILINPFTGLTQLYREDKDFEWTYGRKEQ